MSGTNVTSIVAVIISFLGVLISFLFSYRKAIKERDTEREANVKNVYEIKNDISKIKDNVDEIKEKVEKIDNKLQNDHERLIEHETKIKNLEKEVFKPKQSIKEA